MDSSINALKRLKINDLTLLNYQIFSLVFVYLKINDLIKVKHLICRCFRDGFIINFKGPKCTCCGGSLMSFNPSVQMLRINQVPLMEMEPVVDWDNRKLSLHFNLIKTFDVSFLCRPMCVAKVEERLKRTDIHFNSFYMFMHYDDVCETVISEVDIPYKNLLDDTKINKYYYVDEKFRVNRNLKWDKHNINPNNMYSILKAATINPGVDVLSYYLQKMYFGVTQQMNNTWTMVVQLCGLNILVKGDYKTDEYLSFISICADGYEDPINITKLNMLANSDIVSDNLDYFKL